ncbi:MAG: FAD-dependent thymidylate synthase, partial [Armatimonadetes bacterium]|nr:FAD-dependent thymidylate synthase [Armatimonadota bacterium]
IDLHNLFHFLRLRMDAHAQYEIRVFAEAMATCAKAVSPLAYEAFEEHVLNGVRFSRKECVALGRLLEGGEAELKGRSLAIFEGKLEKIKDSVPIEEPGEPVLPSKS